MLALIMSKKTIVWLFVFFGTTTGNYLPVVWGGSAFSFASVLWSGIGGIVGLFLGMKLVGFVEN